MGRRNLSEFINKWPDELNEEERKIQILVLIPFLMVFIFFLTYIWFEMFIGINFIPFFLVFFFIILNITLILYFWDNLNKKYGMRPTKSPYELSYQSYVICLLCGGPTFFLGMLFLGFTTNNFWFGLGGAVAIVYPIIGMFLRIRTFSDSSIPNKGDFGFMPISYWILATALGLFTVGLGFSDIHLYFANGSPSLEAAVFIIILGLLVQSVYLFPDKLNRVVPFDLRTKNGFWFMFVLAFVLFGVSQWLIGILTALT